MSHQNPHLLPTSRARSSRGRGRFSFLLLATCATFAGSGCGAKSGADPGKVGGETNWLSGCRQDSDCDQGSCSCGICTRRCDVPQGCDELGDAVCSSSDPDAKAAACGAPKLDAPICVPELGEVDGGGADTPTHQEPSPEPPSSSGKDPDPTPQPVEPTPPEPEKATTWSTVISSETFDGVQWDTLWGNDAGELWALGTEAVDPDPAPMNAILICNDERWRSTTYLRRYRDGRWDAVEHPATTSMLALSGTGPDDVWMVGTDGAAFHYDGRTWAEHDVFGAEGLDVDTSDPCHELSLHGVFALSPKDVWVVGYTVPTAGGPGLVLHYDGEVWRRQDTGAPDGFFAVWASAPDDVWTVGSSGLTYHDAGEGWQPVANASDHYLTSMYGTNSGDVWVAGNNGVITHYDGDAWSLTRSPVPYTSNAIVAAGPGAQRWALVLSDWRESPQEQALVQWDGSEWRTESVTQEPDEFLGGLWQTADGQLWGAGKRIVRFR